jgi:hypothetical protein
MDNRRVGFAAAISAFALLLLSLASGANATTILVVSTPTSTYFGADSQLSAVDGSHKYRPFCKLHITDDYVWTSAGPLLESQGPFNLLILANRALRNGITFGQAVTELNEQIGREYPDFRNQLLQSGYSPPNTNIDVAVASRREAGRVSVTSFRGAAPSRITCPEECPQPRSYFVLGFGDAVNSILNRRPAIWDEMKIPEVIRYLIAAQEKETPQLVSGPIAILEVKKNGLHWFSRGSCGVKPPNLRSR